MCNVYGFEPSRLVLWAYDADGVLVMNHALPFTRNLTQEQADSITVVKLVMEGVTADTTYSGRFEIMATTDITAKTYEPYTGGIASPNPEYPQEIRSVGGDGDIEVEVYGKNLAKFANETNKNRKHFSYTSEESHHIEAIKSEEGGNFFARFEAELKKDVTYTISAKESVIIYVYEDELWGSTISGGRKLPTTFTAGKDGIYVIGAYSDGGAGTTVTLTDFQIEEGATATDYKPYTRQSLTIPTPNGLPGIPVKMETEANYVDVNGKYYACDYIDFERGMYVQRIGKMVWDGSVGFGFNNGEVWHISKETIKSNFGIEYLSGLVENGYYVLSNRFLVQHSSYACGTVYKNRMYWAADGSTVAVNGAHLFETQDDNGFKKFFAEHPTIIYCVLKNPIETDLTEEQIAQYKALHTNYPTTTLLSDAPIQVDYVADTKKYIDKKFAELSTALIAMGGI